jgi:hypothetical protein
VIIHGGGGMLLFIFVVGNVAMIVTGVNDGATIVAGFMVNDVPIFGMGEVRSLC